MYPGIFTKKKFFFIFILVSCQLISVNAQESFGIVSSNYAGINSLAINPGNISGSKLFLDINLFYADLFIQNNYLYINKNENKILRLLKDPPDSLAEFRKMLNEFSSNDKKNAFLNFRSIGPSIMMIFGKHGFAFSNIYRSVGSIADVPYLAANLGIFGFQDNPLKFVSFEAYNFSISEMAWMEINLNYSYILSSNGKNQWSAGIALKRLNGIAAAYFVNHKLDYAVTYDSTLIDIFFEADYGYSLPFDYKLNSFDLDQLFKGKGIGFDFGIVYQKNIKNNPYYGFDHMKEQKYADYKYRFGFSLLDVGYINFKENARTYEFKDASTDWESLNEINFNNLFQINNDLSYAFYNDSSLSLKNNNFKMSLPTAFSFQFDYNIINNWFINAVFIQGINLGNNYFNRPSQLAATFRYESDAIEFCIPFSLYRMNKPRIGFAFKIYNLTIGTDNLYGLFNSETFSGISFYLALKLSFAKGRKVVTF